jgi:hypothetical protein
MRFLQTLSLLLLVACAASAQITLSPTSLTFDWVANGFGDEPWPQTVSITGSGIASWASCSGNPTLCSILNLPGTTNNLPVTAVGNLYIRMVGGVGYMTSMTAGTYNATITLSSTTGFTAGSTIAVTLRMHAQIAPTVTSVSGSQTGCSAGTAESGALTYYGLSNCNFQPDMVPGGTFAAPGAGNSYTDANFGGVITQLNDPTVPDHLGVASDSGATNWNANGTYFVAQHLSGNWAIVNYSTLATDYPQSSFAAASAIFQFWDTSNSNVFYFFDQSGAATLHKCTLGSPPTITCSVLYTYVGGGTTQIQNGNNCNPSQDGWVAFWTSGGTDQLIGLLNLNNVSQVYFSPQYSNALWGGMTHGTACVSVGIDSVTGYRYIVRGTNGLSGAFGTEGVEILGYCANSTCGGPSTSIVRLNNWPVILSGVQFPASGSQTPAITSPPYHCSDATFVTGLCHTGAHGCYVQIGGQQFIQLNQATGTPFMQWVVLMLESSGDYMYVPVEAGGGTYAEFPIWAFSDTHNSCSSTSPLAGMDTDSDLVDTAVTNVPSWLITNGTATSPIVVTSSSNYTGSNGDSILAAAVKGLSGLNGVWTVGALSGSTLNAVGTTGSGSYTAGTGVFTKNVKPLQNIPYQNEIMVFDYTNILSSSYTVKRIAKARSVPYNLSYLDSSYYLQEHVNFSPDMTKFNFNSNLGYPDSMAVFLGLTSVAPANPALTMRNATWRFSTAR